MSNAENLVRSILTHINGDSVTEQEVLQNFNAAIADKASDALDYYKLQLATSLYGESQQEAVKEEAEQVDEKAPPGAKYERMVKHIKAKYAKDGLTNKEKAIAYATAWKSYKKNEEIEKIDEKYMGFKKLKAAKAKREGQVAEEADILDEAVKTGNEGRGYHGEHPSEKADAAYSKAHATVKKVAGEAGHMKDVKQPNTMVKHYLDSVHGRHLAGKEGDHEYIKKDFGKFKKTYKPEMHESVELDEKYMGFKKLKAAIAKKGGVRNPGAVAAAIGRKKYGKERFQAMAAAGKRKK